VKQSRPELRFLTERELETAVRLAKRHGDVLAVTAGTGLRFGEISALWVVLLEPADLRQPVIVRQPVRACQVFCVRQLVLLIGGG
jgi:hypothetical protein